MLVALVSGGYTIVLWGHPYAALVLLAEVLFVGIALRRASDRNLPEWVLVFWTSLGLPLVMLVYHFSVDMAWTAAIMVAFKQGLNDLFNALLAVFLLRFMPAWWFSQNARPRSQNVHQLLTNLLVAFAFLPVLVVITINARNTVATTEAEIKQHLSSSAEYISSQLATWQRENFKQLASVAERGQKIAIEDLLLVKGVMPNLVFLQVVNLDGSVRLSTMRGQSATSQVNYADREWFRAVVATRKPIVSDALKGRTSGQLVIVLAFPIFEGERVSGILLASVNGEELARRITSGFHSLDTRVTLVDRRGSIIGSTDRAFLPLQSFEQIRGGLIGETDGRIYRWLPSGIKSPMQAWSSSYYAMNVTQDLEGWSLIVEQPLRPFAADLQRNHLFSFVAIYLLALVAFPLGSRLGRMISLPLRTMSQAATKLALNLDSQGDLLLPHSDISEIASLSDDFQRMAQTLHASYVDLRHARDELELRVAERTAELQQQKDAMDQHAIVSITDADGRIIYANEKFIQISGYDHAELLGQNHRLLNSGCHPKSFFAEMWDTISHGHTWHGHICNRSKHGTHYWVASTIVPFLDQEGAPYQYVSIRTDITEQKHAEEALRIAAIAFETQEGMLVTDAHGVIIRANHAFSRLTGYTEGEVIGNTPALLKSDRHGPEFFLRMWQLLEDNGYWQGEIWNKRKDGRIYAEWLTISAVKAPDGTTTHYVGTFTEITKNKDAEAEVHRLAYYDPLTQLPNRRLLQDRLKQAILGSHRSRQHGALLFLDLDNFKKLNDTRGHKVGDQLLIEAAQRMKGCVREGDTVARLGGDEFVILLEGLSENSQEAALQVDHVAEKVRKVLQRPYELSGQDFHCSSSIGITLIHDDVFSAEEALRHADLALYKAKDAGRNCFRFFDPAMQEVLDQHAKLEADLRQAVENGQLCLHYQPQIDDAHRIIGAEALLRWQHPAHGLVPPGNFIPLAEETGLILPIGQWVLETICSQIREWSATQHASQLRFSVNVSAAQFRQSDFVAQLEAVLAKTGANPRQLKIELTESMVLDDIDDTLWKMHALKLLGISLSLDDFGTGYSSLSYLTQLPLDQLKIDRSFVFNLPDSHNDAVVAQTIVAMAKGLGLEVIAEGVETEGQLEFLQRHGCHAYQGYLFSRPLPLAGFETYLQHHASGLAA
jgi:diguanylate cyclase (GGDEF)-like protein/PAS domain S-box-containing protein